MLIAAKDVNQAVQMATEMRDAGEYQWFRGQTCNWTLQSSLARRHDSHDKEISRANLFLNWVQLTDGLETLSSNLDSAVAVAQHYGIATHFIDFTTEPHVAGYFASEGITAQEPKAFGLDAEEKRFFGKMPATADIGCILCFNREKVMRVWDLVSGHLPEEAKPECLQLQVADLWRLEAQHGVFFYCPVDRFEEVVYDFDRIVFPHTGQVEWPPENMIYPDRKSHLEQLLDQYFQLEKIKAGRPLFDKLSAAVKAKPLVIEDSSGSADYTQVRLPKGSSRRTLRRPAPCT